MLMLIIGSLLIVVGMCTILYFVTPSDTTYQHVPVRKSVVCKQPFDTPHK